MSMIFNDFVNQVAYSYVKVSNVIYNSLSVIFVPGRIKKTNSTEPRKVVEQNSVRNMFRWSPGVAAGQSKSNFLYRAQIRRQQTRPYVPRLY